MTKVNSSSLRGPNTSFLPVQTGLAQEQRRFGPVKELNRQGISLSTTPPLLQAKLTIGAANDPYEREADRAAETVMRMPSPTIQMSKAEPRLQRLASITARCTDLRGDCPSDSQDARDSRRALEMMQQTEAGRWLMRELNRNENLLNSAIVIDFTSAVVRREGGTYGSFFPMEVGAARYTAYVDTIPHRAIGRAQPRDPNLPLPRPVDTYGGGAVVIPSYVVERPSMMAETLYHELLHIWYINTFSELGLAHPDHPQWGSEPFTGHRDASQGEIERPFARRLRQFAEEIYRRETAPPAAPTSVPAPAPRQPAPVQRKQVGSPSCDSDSVPSIVHETLRSPGQPLDAQTRAYLEPRFGHDFSRVRVHTDTRAAESARAVNAQAYTVGSDIVFGTGAYSPSTYAGRQLVAHEMAHVVQQQQASAQARGSMQRRIVVENPAQRPPRAPSTATNASIINSYASTLCSGFSVDNSGVFHPSSDTYCNNAATTSTPESCQCLCYLNSLRDAAGNDIEWKVFVADDKWPHTNIPSLAPQPGEPRRSVFVPSPYSGMQYGSWSTSPNAHRLTQGNWLVFGHELCGHGWLDERHQHPLTNVVVDDARVTHDPTVAVENRIASEHGIPASEQRALWATGGRHHGESLSSVTIAKFPSGSADFYSTPPEEQRKINIARDFMRSTPSVRADVIGHADHPARTPTINQTISLQRARNVRAVLVGRGIDSGRFVSVVGKADTECPAPGQQPLCRKAVVYMFNYLAASESHG